MSENAKPVRNWGKPLAVVGLVFGIISLVIGLLAWIPLIGLIFGIITLIFGIITVSFAIPGLIGSFSKKVAVVALVFGSYSVVWGGIRTAWAASIVNSASTSTSTSVNPRGSYNKIHDTVSVNKLQFTVNSVYNTKRVGTEYIGANTSNNFAVVNITVKNNGTSEFSLLSEMMAYHIGDNTYEPNSAGIYLDDGFYVIETIGAGLSKAVSVVYEIPSNYKTSDYVEFRESAYSYYYARVYLE